MGRRIKNSDDEGRRPGTLLRHDDPYDIAAKLAWEAGQFEALRIAEPPIDIDGMVYLLQNACISAVAAVEWLGIALKRTMRGEKRVFDDAAFQRMVLEELPHFQLARAIANTFRHGTYRDEGWGEATFRLDPMLTFSQHERLRALEGTEAFHEAFAEEAAEARFRILFTRGETPDAIDASAFVSDLDRGVLRLLDASGDLDQFTELQEGPAAPKRTS